MTVVGFAAALQHLVDVNVRAAVLVMRAIEPDIEVSEVDLERMAIEEMLEPVALDAAVPVIE